MHRISFVRPIRPSRWDLSGSFAPTKDVAVLTSALPFNTILFGSGKEASRSFIDLMKTLAKDNGGQFSHVKESDLQ